MVGCLLAERVQHDDKTHASPTKAQLAIRKEWKAQKEGGKPPAAPKPKAAPKKAAAPAANEAGDEVECDGQDILPFMPTVHIIQWREHEPVRRLREVPLCCESPSSL